MRCVHVYTPTVTKKNIIISFFHSSGDQKIQMMKKTEMKDRFGDTERTNNPRWVQWSARRHSCKKFEIQVVFYTSQRTALFKCELF